MDNKTELINKNNFSIIWNIVDEIVFQNKHFKTEKIKRAFLLKLIDTNLPNATFDEKRSEYYSILGYINYFCDENKRSQKTINFFKRAIKFNKNNYLAWIYLGYWHFDNEQWRRALNAFKKIPEEMFGTFCDILRFKITELKLCCRLYLNPSKKTIGNIKNFLHKLSFQDEENRALPVEMKKAIEQAKLNSTNREILLSLIKDCM